MDRTVEVHMECHNTKYQQPKISHDLQGHPDLTDEF